MEENSMIYFLYQYKDEFLKLIYEINVIYKMDNSKAIIINLSNVISSQN